LLAYLSSADRLLAAPIVWGGKHVNVSDVLVFDNPGSKGDERRHVLWFSITPALRETREDMSYLVEETWKRRVLVAFVKWQNGTDRQIDR
jgi:hypothetical protein